MPQSIPTTAGRSGGARRRTIARTVAAVVAATLIPVTLVGTAGAAKKPKPVVKVSVGETKVFSVGNGPPAVPDEVQSQVIATLDAYLRAATVRPLQKGEIDPVALAATFGPAAAARLGGPDLDVLTDQGLPKAEKKIVVKAAPVTMTGLADEKGQLVMVAAALETTTKTKTVKGKVVITRNGEVVFKPDAGTWKISGYSLAVDRTGKGLGPAGTTTTTAAPAAGAPAR